MKKNNHIKTVQKVLGVAVLASCLQTAMAAPKVVSSIYPLQQIANAITGEQTQLVADSYLSPHSYTLKPSEARQVINADLFVWVGDVMMPQLKQFVEKRQEKHKITITASRVVGVHLIKLNHDETSTHQQAHSEFQPADKAEENNKNDSAEDKAKHNAEHEHSAAYDPHLWLSTENAKAIASEIAKKLSQMDNANEARYQANLKRFIAKLEEVKKTIKTGFEDNPPKPYFIFHDAYGYFEKEFGLSHADKIRSHAGQAPQTKHLADLKAVLSAHKDACLFREPQFESPLITQLTEDSQITVATLDPLGYVKDSADNKDKAGYARILQNLADALQNCGKPLVPKRKK